jgi:hypothetical protein
VKTSGKSFGADARAVTAELRRSFSRRNRGNRPPHNPQPQHAGFFRRFLGVIAARNAFATTSPADPGALIETLYLVTGFIIATESMD